jgi:hypothetical protein
MPRGDGIIAAKLAGTISRLSPSDVPFEEQLAEVLATTRDPRILGRQLGNQLAAEYPNKATAAAIELLRAAGADEAEAERMAEWQRERQRRRAEGGFTL